VTAVVKLLPLVTAIGDLIFSHLRIAMTPRNSDRCITRTALMLATAVAV
jgi:hypothetical protein